MSQEYQVVPAALLELAVNALAGVAPGRFAVETELRAIVDGPVPPAGGEVEVFAYYLHPLGDLEHGRFLMREDAKIADPSKSDHHGTVVLVDRAHVTRLQAENAALQQRLNVADQRVDEMETMLNTPHTAEWFEGVRLEAGHQIGRWGTEHDSGKEPADWFWLIGYLAQKAMTAQMSGDEEKARHHTISTGAAMLNWFRAIVGDSNAMRPGIDAHQSAPAAKGGE